MTGKRKDNLIVTLPVVKPPLNDIAFISHLRHDRKDNTTNDVPGLEGLIMTTRYISDDVKPKLGFSWWKILSLLIHDDHKSDSASSDSFTPINEGLNMDDVILDIGSVHESTVGFLSDNPMEVTNGDEHHG